MNYHYRVSVKGAIDGVYLVRIVVEVNQGRLRLAMLLCFL